MAAVDVLESELITAAEAGTGLADADAARLAINQQQAAAIAKYVKTVVEGSTNTIPGLGLFGYSATPITGSATGTIVLGS